MSCRYLLILRCDKFFTIFRNVHNIGLDKLRWQILKLNWTVAHTKSIFFPSRKVGEHSIWKKKKLDDILTGIFVNSQLPGSFSKQMWLKLSWYFIAKKHEIVVIFYLWWPKMKEYITLSCNNGTSLKRLSVPRIIK